MTITDDNPLAQRIALAPTLAEIRAEERVMAAISQLSRGEAIILTDGIGSPTSGEVVFPAARISTADAAFAIRYSSGFLQVALPPDRCDALWLPAQQGAAPGTAQCVTVDAATGITTGISAADRARTIRLLASPDASPASFSRPGHVVPLRADAALPISDFGHPEAAVHLVAAAGFPPAAVLTTVVGTTHPTDVASGNDLQEFARTHQLPIVGLRDLDSEKTPLPILHVSVDLPSGRTSLESFTDLGHNYLVVAVGEVSGREDVPVHLLPADRVLIDAGSPGAEPRILIGLPQTPEDEYGRAIDGLHRQHSMIRAVLRRLGCLSVLAHRRPDSLR
ncbi:probable 3,4-dihydroxy-2-butanone 4-phosphate synthase (plasmid) [Rhodococcus jostii RHA1]|uniref:3,4-dihydroxy-2-butanone-4-phosphate synthase n=2 Tax=Rhodococcus jostii TaxID=132919 RepID=Q0RX58_RHOJR|nr:3,4-dihydroxy-2-butanone-4-phosphate synthase [Rhodococcus jostii]ABH00128.1 probable 3,4-dihydroxy-2-butanone 4-phosphate synthase [Rhodococcus jostii RHA1]